MDLIIGNIMNKNPKEKVDSELTKFQEMNISESTFNRDERNPIFNKEDLTVDGLPTVEAQMRELKRIEALENKIKEINEEKNKRREMINMIRFICLHKMGKSPMINTNYLTNIEKETLILLMNSYGAKVESEIKTEFNNICNQTIFSNKFDYSTLPIYNA